MHIDWSNYVTVNSACFPFSLSLSFCLRLRCCGKDFLADIANGEGFKSPILLHEQAACVQFYLLNFFGNRTRIIIFPVAFATQFFVVFFFSLSGFWMICQRESGVCAEWIKMDTYIFDYLLLFYFKRKNKTRHEKKEEHRSCNNCNDEKRMTAMVFLDALVLSNTFSCWVSVFFFFISSYDTDICFLFVSRDPAYTIHWAHRLHEKLEIKASNKNSTRQKPQNRRTELTCQNRNFARNKSRQSQPVNLVWLYCCVKFKPLGATSRHKHIHTNIYTHA